VAGLPGFGNPNRNNPNAGENNPREDTAKFFANTDLLADLREVYDSANRNNTAIYSLDPRGLSAGEFDIDQNVSQRLSQAALNDTQDTLRVLANETDGRAIVNRNDLGRGLEQVVRDSSGYYLLGYNSTQAPTDGKFHEIKVRVKRSGVQVRSRKGYWALTADDTARALAPPKAGPPPAVEKALASVAEPTRGRYVRTWIGMSRGENGKTKVTFVWEPLPRVPGVDADLPARVSLSAGSATGTSYFRGKVPDVALASAAPAGGSAASSPSRGPSRVTFDADPGRMQMRMTVEGANAQVLDSDQRDVQVPDLTAAMQLSTPQVFRASTPREFQAIRTDPDGVPVASREFRRTDRLLIRFEAYAAASKPAATLLNRSGQKMSDVGVTDVSSGVFQIDLPLAGLAPGEYLLEIKVKGEAGESSELIPLKVTS
jgi:hypothetical protein